MKVAKGVGLCYFSGEYECRGLDAVYLTFRQARKAEGKDWLRINDGKGDDIQAFSHTDGSVCHTYRHLTERRGVFIVQTDMFGRPLADRVCNLNHPVKRAFRMVSANCRKANSEGKYYDTKKLAFQLKGWFKNIESANSECVRLAQLVTPELMNKAMAVYPDPYEFDLKELDGASLQGR